MKQSQQCDRFQAFSIMEETQPWSSCGCFFCLFVCFHLLPPFSLNEDQMLLSQASSDLKLIFSPLLMNAKITHHVT